MRRIALLLCLCGALAGTAHAQTVAPIATLNGDITDLRTQANGLAELMVGERLNQPAYLHNIADLFNQLAVITDQIATHAEHHQITTAQRQALEAEINRTRLMLQQLSAQIGVVPASP